MKPSSFLAFAVLVPATEAGGAAGRAALRASRLSRLLWPLCGLLLAALVIMALPGQRIELGASQLKGLVGSYTGHGNWLIQASYSGSCTVTTTGTGGVTGGGAAAATIGGGQIYNVSGGTWDLAALVNTPSQTSDGGISGALDTAVTMPSTGGTPAIVLSTSNAKINLTLTWLPENNDPIYDPAPRKVAVFYRHLVTASTTASTILPSQFDGVSSYANLNCDGIAVSASDHSSGGSNAPPVTNGNSDPEFIEEKLSVSGGMASKTFSINSTLHIDETADTDDISDNYQRVGNAWGTNRVDFCVAGFDMTRFGKSLRPFSGGHASAGKDPTFTRWLPLAFSPEVTSQPFRYQAGALPGPWGNINCMYSLALRQEPASPNLDLDGTALEVLPTLEVNGAYVNPSSPFTLTPGAFTPRYSITDANGDRLLFNADWTPFADVHSTLVNQGGGLYQLTNAGPPGAMRETGDYTYTFLRTSIYNQPLVTRLISITDALNNTQTLNWTANNALTVTDSSSGRSLVFNAGTNGYFGSVDAPEVGSGVHTHTALTFDANGHCTAVNVYAGNSTVLLHSDVFGYGGTNSDAVTSEQQGVSVTSHSYVFDPLAADPFGVLTPRLSSTTAGSSGDSSSSDDGGSVAGTVSYTYGPTQKGYNWWGVSAHTNTVTDARGSLFTTLFALSGEVYGDLVGLTSTGPNFTGSAAINKVRTAYSPNIDQPQSISFYDQLYYAGQSTQPWLEALDLFGNLTSVTDPLNHTWSFGYTADGKYLASIVDPTNIGVGFAYGERNNPASRLTSFGDAASGSTLIDYNRFGQPTVVTTPAGNSASGQTEQASLNYDAVTGDFLSITNPLGDIMSVTGYDALGDPLGLAVFPDTGSPTTSQQVLVASFMWNASQQVTQVTRDNGVRVNNTWNNGILTQLQCNASPASGGSLLSQMALGFDSRGRLYSAVDLAGLCAQYRYDKNSNLTRIFDGNGNATTLLYGNNNEPTGILWPDQHRSTLNYDAAGRVRQSIDERGIICNFVYDNARRLTDIQWPTYSAENVRYTYDDAGRVLTVLDSSGSRAYDYDANGRLHQVTTVYGALPIGHNTYLISYGYYGDGSVAWVDAPDGRTSYQYNTAGQITQITHPNGLISQYFYDHIGRIINQTVSTGTNLLATTYTWGVSGLANDPSTAPVYLRQMAQSVGSQTWTYTLTHSLLGQLTRQDETSSQANLNGFSVFAYDLRGRLNSENLHWRADANTAYDVSSGYSFDAANNVQAGANGWTVNSSNQVTSAPTVAGSSGLSGATGLSYDVAGNTHTLNNLPLTYDCWGRLVSTGNNVSYHYDSAGRRVSKTFNGQTTYFLYDCGLLIAEVDANGNLTRSYHWGTEGLLADTIYVSAGLQTRLYVFDGLGNTRSLVDGNTGAILWQGAWTAWGQLNCASSPPTSYGYKGRCGQYGDSETGLLYLKARYYSPALGRFLSRDPIAHAGGINLYAYCGGDCVNYADPSGLDGQLGFDFGPEPTSTTTYQSPVSTTQVAAEQTVAGETTALTSETSTSLVEGLSADSALGVAGIAAAGITAGHTLGDEIADYIEVCEEVKRMAAEPVHLANKPHHGTSSTTSASNCKQARPTHPSEKFRRDKHYGRTPNTAQKKAAGDGYIYDHIPPLVQHYYEGDGKGGIPGYQMTQAEREAYAKKLGTEGKNWQRVTKKESDSQGGITRGYGVRMKKKWGLN